MKRRALWTFIALLATTCVAQDYYIQNQTPGPSPGREAPDAWLRGDEWFQQVRKRMREGSPAPFLDFDELLDDRFFGRRFDPFAEMLELQRRFDPQPSEGLKRRFPRTWDDWFSRRVGLPEIQAETMERDGEVLVELLIPGLDKDSLNIDVNGSRVRVAYEAKEVHDKKDGSGREYFRSESTRRFERRFPVPESADGRGSRIEREGDVVRIIFPRRPRGVKADA